MSENVSFEDEQSSGGGFRVDLSSADENAKMEVLPRGIYPFEIVSCDFGDSSAGNPMWSFQLQVTEGDYAGRKLFFHMPFMDSMRNRNKKILLRIAPELVVGPFDPQEIADQGYMIGKRGRARVDIRPYQGEPRNNVRDILPPDESQGGTSFM